MVPLHLTKEKNSKPQPALRATKPPLPRLPKPQWIPLLLIPPTPQRPARGKQAGNSFKLVRNKRGPLQPPGRSPCCKRDIETNTSSSNPTAPPLPKGGSRSIQRYPINKMTPIPTRLRKLRTHTHTHIARGSLPCLFTQPCELSWNKKKKNPPPTHPIKSWGQLIKEQKIWRNSCVF